MDCSSPNGNDNAAEIVLKPKVDPGKCLNAGQQGKGKALGHCGNENRGIKSQHFFDANDAAAFEKAFEAIGKKIVNSNVRLGE